VTFSFWHFSQNTPENYKAIFRRLDADATGAEVCFVLQPAYLLTRFEINYGCKYGETNATVCLIWVSGWGDSPAVAHSRWRNAIRNLVTFFAELKPTLEYGPAAGSTVSQHFLNMMPRTLPDQDRIPNELDGADNTAAKNGSATRDHGESRHE
jgi:hypothetical protein